uniref:GST N-terminal domain-containing protein n=1 Tax=Chromera velia CCMP2878 TaxID=1169474 RepID=A0A0G4F4E7_9ALVE|eukprot:Cvel_15016.t1-p1 / transcript=Cvel_15016.t1 / gene=Cvel_15016 / organism=Chromera_velia_CCMP2878 / gene_product=Glutaredoxin-2, putative / transcript_product=Glutaredoxin-2, putative / location=Cvel_scaffold1093:833-1693(-) / protein_length=287 / sequence_SO=supercontig / SO=protein_coding / is_pseudo=false
MQSLQFCAMARLFLAALLCTQGAVSGALLSRNAAFQPGLENMPSGSPRLYGYEHSHYTLRCRMVLGLKRIPYRMIWVAEDDAETPTNLVGKKITPIMEIPGEGAMCESLDIIERLEGDGKFGPRLLKQKTDRSDIDAWIKKLSIPMRNLGRPRYIRSSVLPEFHSSSARQRFVTTHPLPFPDSGKTLSKADWAQLAPEERVRVYDHYWDKSAELLEEMNEVLQQGEGLIDSADAVSPHGLSFDDVFFYSRMRGISLIKGLKMPPSLDAYLNKMAEKSDVPLLNQMAL